MRKRAQGVSDVVLNPPGEAQPGLSAQGQLLLRGTGKPIHPPELGGFFLLNDTLKFHLLNRLPVLFAAFRREVFTYPKSRNVSSACNEKAQE